MDQLTDFHSHILPGIDDGSSSAAESIAMLQLEAEQGIRRVVATPHFYAHQDSPERFLEKRKDAYARLREAMAQHSGLPDIILGAEVSFFRGMSESERLAELTIGQKNGILIEMPPAPWPDAVYRELEEIWQKLGIMPIVAHVDRYIGPLRTYDIPRRLAEMPVMVQANAGFFLNRKTDAMAMRMLRLDQIQLLGSDCHNLSSRKPDLGAAAERIGQKLGQDAISRIHGYEHRVLDL